MMTTTAEQMRAWTGPAILTYGFRPFFFGAAIWAALAMTLWVPMLSGHLTLPTAFDPVSWHAHEFLFGYLGAVIAGFLSTAVPNWTGRLPIVGWPLGGLFLLWLAGRMAVAVSGTLPAGVAATVDLSFPLVLAAAIGREIVAGKNWRNLIVLAMLAVFALGNGLYHWEAARGDYAAQGYGLRLGLAAGVMMIAVIGGRIIPTFTRNWLVRRGPGPLPMPFDGDDKVIIGVTAFALVLWVAMPDSVATAIAMLAAGIANLWRLSRWAGWRSLAEPLVAILHLAYLFLPLGFFAMSAATLFPDLVPHSAGLHTWTVGAIVLMTLAVMTRASLGHSGMPLTADLRITAIYGLASAAALARVGAGLMPQQGWLLDVAAICWVLAFGLFALVYAPLFLRRRSTAGAGAGNQSNTTRGK